LAILAFHLWHLADIPRGLWKDETAIGYNALLIAQSGYDEHHHFLPVYFESFGDYKAPVYIYAVAVVFKILGASDFTLRLTTAMFFLLFLAGFLLLVRDTCGRRPAVQLYALGAAGFMPWFFTLSRISIEIISQATVVIFALLCTHRMLAADTPRLQRRWAFAAGLLTAITLYCYPTSRLLTPALATTTLLVSLRRDTLKRSVVYMAGLCMGITPHIAYTLGHPGAMTARFRRITYVFDPALSLKEKITTFVGNYFSYIDPHFLLLHGDRNLLFATGHGGQLFFVVFALGLVGIAVLLLSERAREEPFNVLLLLNTVIAPTAAALTNDGTPHSVRSLLLGLYLLLLSCIGFTALLSRLDARRATVAACALLALLTFETTIYIRDYFTRYVVESATAQKFHSYGMREAAERGVAEQPQLLIFSKSIRYSTPEFIRRTMNSGNVLVDVREPIPEQNTCIVYLPEDDSEVSASQLPYRDLSIPDAVTRLRCYGDSTHASEETAR
jgi:4-amino-4-deoxy-L-arabinose transferase-like glycosyltransferase